MGKSLPLKGEHMAAGNELLSSILTPDVIGNFGIALMTFVASGLGFLFSSRLSRHQARKDLKREKLEAFCVAIQDAIFHIVQIEQSDNPPQGFILANETDSSDAALERALQQAHTYKMLYLQHDFNDAYHRVIQASRVIHESQGDLRGYNRKHLGDLLLALNGLMTLVWEEFRTVLA